MKNVIGHNARMPEADNINAQFTVRLAKDQAVKMDEWMRRTGQPAVLVFRAAFNSLFTLMEPMSFADQVEFVASLGNAPLPTGSDLVQELAATMRPAPPKKEASKQGRKSG